MELEKIAALVGNKMEVRGIAAKKRNVLLSFLLTIFLLCFLQSKKIKLG